MHITNEQLQIYHQQLEIIYANYTKKLKIKNILNVVSPIVFLIISWIITYCGLLFLDRTALLEEQALTKLKVINDFCEPIMKLLQFGTLAWYIVLPICLVVIIFLPFAINAIIALIVKHTYKGKKLPDMPLQTIPKLKKMIEFAEVSKRRIFESFEDSFRIINWLYLLFLAVVFVYIYVMLKFPLEMIVFTIIGFALVLTAFFWIYKLLLLPFGALSEKLFENNITPALKLLEKLNTDLTAEEKLKKEETERNRREEQRRIEAKRKKEEAAKLKEANALYEKAIANEKYDEKLMKKAADMGSPEACLYQGKKLVKKWSTEPLTRSEKLDVCRMAASYLSSAAYHSTEGEFLWLLTRTQYEKNNKNKWKNMLDSARKIKSSGELPQEYEETCDLLLETLVDIVDSTPDTSPSNPPSAKEPKIKYVYCKFNNAGICTQLSTSYNIAHCTCMKNPGNCSVCLNNNGYGVEFE